MIINTCVLKFKVNKKTQISGIHTITRLVTTRQDGSNKRASYLRNITVYTRKYIMKLVQELV